MKRHDRGHFLLVFDGGSYVAQSPSPRPGCPSSIEATKNCPTQKAKDNWRAATGRCVIIEPIDDSLFGINGVFAFDLDLGLLSEGLHDQFRQKDVSLSATATVSVEEVGKNWLITDGERYFRLVRRAQTIAVYTGDRPL